MMKATVYEILGRERVVAFSMADVGDFVLRESGEVEAEEILRNGHISLYTLDLEKRRAVFVETPPELDLSFAPFYFIAQFENALRVLMISFETMIELAQLVAVDDGRMVFIHSVGRSGSTLASQIFAEVPGVISLSEPDALMLMIIARFSNPGNEAELVRLLDAVIRMLCKERAERAWVIKGRSYVIELADWLDGLYPKARNLFLYRDGEQYLGSALGSIINNTGRTAEEIRANEVRMRADFGIVTPLVNSYDPTKHLSSVGILCLMWVGVMERYVWLHEQGVEMLAIRYRSWRTAPRETALAMLRYCNCLPEDLSGVEAALARDSQAGTALAQDRVQRKAGGPDEAALAELKEHLAAHPLIKTADYEAPNTLRI